MLQRNDKQLQRRAGDGVRCAGDPIEQRVAFGRGRRVLERQRERAGERGNRQQRRLASEHRVESRRVCRVAAREAADAADQRRTTVAGHQHLHLRRGGNCAVEIAEGEQRFGGCLQWRGVVRDDARRLAPRRDRFGQAPELPLRFADCELRIRRAGIEPCRAMKAEHRVDRPAFVLVRPAALHPLRVFGGGHQRVSRTRARPRCTMMSLLRRSAASGMARSSATRRAPAGRASRPRSCRPRENA